MQVPNGRSGCSSFLAQNLLACRDRADTGLAGVSGAATQFLLFGLWDFSCRSRWVLFVASIKAKSYRHPRVRHSRVRLGRRRLTVVGMFSSGLTFRSSGPINRFAIDVAA